MAVTSEIVRKYIEVDKDNETGNSTLLCRVKWNGREPKGYDIRKYDSEQDKVYKGITLSIEALQKIIISAIENGLVDNDIVEEKLREYKDKIFTPDKFSELFNNMADEDRKYKRDKHGYLRDDRGTIIISKRIR